MFRLKSPSSDEGSSRCRSDVTFLLEGKRYDVELKTPNANWRMPGVINITRPITQNIAEIVNDGNKLRVCSGQGIVAFVLFPVPVEDRQWEVYLERLALALDLSLSVQEHTSRLSIPLRDDKVADFIICCFDIPNLPLSLCKVT